MALPQPFVDNRKNVFKTGKAHRRAVDRTNADNYYYIHNIMTTTGPQPPSTDMIDAFPVRRSIDDNNLHCIHITYIMIPATYTQCVGCVTVFEIRCKI